MHAPAGSALPTENMAPERFAAASGAVDAAPRPRLLLMAVACSPKHGSEPGIGWNRALQAARFCDVWVVTEEGEYAREIRAYLEQHGPIDHLRFEFVSNGTVGTWLRRSRLAYYLSYNLWQRRAFKVARNLHAEVGFQLAHHVTYCGYREPGYVWKLPVPFILGPMGGTQNYPWRFLSCASPWGAFQEASRSLLNCIQMRISLRVRRALKAARLVLSASQSVREDLYRVLGRDTQVTSEIGITQVRAQPRPVRAAGRPLRLLWSGEWRTRKALPLLIEALAQLAPGTQVELRVLGRGNMGQFWQKLAVRRGVADRIQWLGWLPHAQAVAQLEWADVFVFTSLRDTSGTVSLEALASGIPVLCIDHQGMRDIVTDACGIKVPLTTPARVARDFATAIERLAASPELCAELGRAGLARAAEYQWTRLGEAMGGFYLHRGCAVKSGAR
jgi:glycosyltransferase involved in cell wall biosynthesis